VDDAAVDAGVINSLLQAEEPVQLQALQQQAPPPRAPLRRRATGARAGFPGPAPTAAAAAARGSAAAIAASEKRAVHVSGGVLSAYSLDPATGVRDATLAQIRLQDLFAPIGSSNCRDGVYDASAVYDTRASRFYVAAACGGTGSALLAVSATSEPASYWYLYNLNADGVGTALACASGEAALADYPRLTFNADALAVSVRTYCPSAGGAAGAPGAGAALMVLPKGPAANGETRLAYALFTSHEVAAAASAAAAAAGGERVAAGSVLQLEPAVPQSAADVNADHMYFVADVSTWLGAVH
jgi:hypothetical protein